MVLFVLRTGLHQKSRKPFEPRSNTVLRTMIRLVLTVPYYPLNLNLKKRKNKKKKKKHNCWETFQISTEKSNSTGKKNKGNCKKKCYEFRSLLQPKDIFHHYMQKRFEFHRFYSTSQHQIQPKNPQQ